METTEHLLGKKSLCWFQGSSSLLEFQEGNRPYEIGSWLHLLQYPPLPLSSWPFSSRFLKSISYGIVHVTFYSFYLVKALIYFPKSLISKDT